MEQLENSLRVKITGACNRNCFFCHREGGMDGIDEVQFTPELALLIKRLHQDLNISYLAITGGEPLLHSNLASFFKDVVEQTEIKGFSLTTNGTIEKSECYWKTLKACGLYKVNLSISDILDSVEATNSKTRKTIFKNQVDTISMLNSLGITPNINVVVYNDKKHLINLLNFLFAQKTLQFDIALLPDLTNERTFKRSQTVISDAIKYYSFKKIKARHRKGTSNTVCDYEAENGFHLQVKTTKLGGTPKWLNSLCCNCAHKEHCQEGFYGIRLENKNGQLMLRLCLYRSDLSTLMDMYSFFDSPIYEELCLLWNN